MYLFGYVLLKSESEYFLYLEISYCLYVDHQNMPDHQFVSKQWTAAEVEELWDQILGN